MQLNDRYKLNEHETMVELQLNWFDLSKEAQEKIMSEISKAVENTNNTFGFPVMNVSMIVRTADEKGKFN